MEITRKFNWVSALDSTKKVLLEDLQQAMANYYSGANNYYADISFNENIWADKNQKIQIDIADELQKHETILEVGCGKSAILAAYPMLEKKYTGVDFSEVLMKTNKERFPGANFGVLSNPVVFPYADESFDAIFSHFVIEHAVFPHLFLEECVRVLKPGGKFLLVCPDFMGYDGITSQRVGFSQGSGRDKIKQGKIADAIVTGFDSKYRLPNYCRKLKQAAKVSPLFMINLAPTCFTDPFQPDVDAVYVTNEEEMKAYIGQFVKWDGLSDEVKAYRDNRHLIYIKGVKYQQ